jgi:hypothetical protein
MTYAQYGLIQAADYNNFTGLSSSVSTGANQLNTILGVGNGNAGYGQTVVPTVTVGNVVSHSNWQSLIYGYTELGNHQSTAITATTVPVQGAKIEVLNPISTNLTSLYTNRLNAASQAASTAYTTTNATTWASAITFTHTITFASANHARYFFNTGGQLAVTFGHPTGAGINALWNTLATACGTIVLSSTNSGAVTIAGTSYNGITKVGGSGSTSVLSTNTGYYGLTTSYVQAFKQVASSGLAKYLGSFISVEVRSNGSNLGGNGDNGSVINIKVTFDEVPDGGSFVVTSAGTTSTVTVRSPSSTYLATNTWGTPSVNGTVT